MIQKGRFLIQTRKPLRLKSKTWVLNWKIRTPHLIRKNLSPKSPPSEQKKLDFKAEFLYKGTFMVKQ